MDIKQILLLVGIGIYYYLKYRSGNKEEQKKPVKRARPKAPPANPTPVDQSKTSLEEILRNLVEEEAPRKPKPRAKIKHVEVDQTTPKAKSAETTPRRTTEKKKRIEVEDLDAAIDFDLRQAVINDAILNRPEY